MVELAAAEHSLFEPSPRAAEASAHFKAWDQMVTALGTYFPDLNLFVQAAEVLPMHSLDDDVILVGHSLVDPLPLPLQHLVTASGGGGVIQRHTIPGAPLETNWKDAHMPHVGDINARATLAEGNTEVLIITERVPILGVIEWHNAQGYALLWHDLAVTSKAGARTYLYESWTDLRSGTNRRNEEDPEGHVPWRARLDRDLARWEGIADYVNANRVPGSNEMLIIPAGQAMARLYDAIAAGQVPGVTDIRAFFSDDIHLNDVGAYFVSMVHYATVYGRSPVGLPHRIPNQTPPPADLALVLQEIAWEAVVNYPRSGIGERAGIDQDQEPDSFDVAEAALDDDGDDVGINADEAGGLNPAPKAPPTAAQGLANPSLSIGLNGLADWTSQQPFIDVMKTARGWTGHVTGQWGGWDHDDLAAGGYLDANGWPKKIPAELSGVETFLFTEMPAGAVSLAGRYQLTYKGVGKILLLGRVDEVSYRPGEIWFEFTPGEGTVGVTIARTDPQGVGDHIRDITIVKEENIELHEAGVVFNPHWLRRIEDFRTLRFMDWMNTNGSRLSDWDARPKVKDYTYSVNGAPLEIMVALANETGADPWFTLPHLATDDHIRHFAEYVRDHLDPRLKAHVEFSNEVWNWQFEQAHWAHREGQARWGADVGDAWVQHYGMRAAQLAMIWDEAFGADADSRLVKVISTQTGWLGLEASLLEAPLWVAEDPSRNRAPAEYFDAYAVTGYFDAGLGSEDKAPVVLSWVRRSREAAEAEAEARGLVGVAREAYVAAHRYDLATALAARELRDGSVTGGREGSVAHLFNTLLPHHAEVAARAGLDLIMYEGGTHVVGRGPWVEEAELTDFFIHLNYASEMGGLYETLLQGWKEVGGTLFNAFVDVSNPSKWGSWGALRHLDDVNPRWDALTAFNRGAEAWWEARDPAAFVHGVTLSGAGGGGDFEGTIKTDTLLGGPRDDRLVGHGGDDRLHGGGGDDTAVLPGRFREHSFRTEGAALLAAGPSGVTRLVEVETLVFAEEPDRRVAVSDLP